MAKSIITQDGNIVNYSNLLGFELLGSDSTKTAIVLGRFADEQSAEKTKAAMIRWLKREAFSTFEMPPVTDESGDY